MYKILISFFIITATLLSISCNANSTIPVINSNSVTEVSPPIIENQKPTASNDYCKEWERTYNLLDEESKQSLEEKWIAFGHLDSEYNQAYYVLSPKLVSDCEQRVQIGRFIWLVILGRDNESDHKFASQNSKEIVKVLRHIWSSPNFSRDGTHSEKYNLLNYEGIKDDDMALLLGDLIIVKEINYGLLNILTEKPLPVLKPVLLDSLKESEKKGDLIQQICYLIILQQISPSPSYLSKLEEFSSNETLGKETKIELSELIKRFKEGKTFKSEDIDKLNLELLGDAEQDKNPKIPVK